MKPSGDRMTPEPIPCSGARNAVSVFSLSVLSAKPLVSTCTTDLVTSADNACTDSLNTCSGSFLSALAASAVRVGGSVCAAQNTGAVVNAATRMATHRAETSIRLFYGKSAGERAGRTIKDAFCLTRREAPHILASTRRCAKAAPAAPTTLPADESFGTCGVVDLWRHGE